MPHRRLAPSLLLGVDDTDTRHGGCTTHTALAIAAAVDAADGPLATWRLVDAPRLVRLDPAAPERTRGNGAVVLPLAPAGTPRHVVGAWGGRPLVVHGARPSPANEGDGPEARELLEAALAALGRIVDHHLPAPGPPTSDPQPGAVVVGTPPAEALYGAAVARLVTHDESMGHAPRGTHWLTPDKRRGTIGALAATAWPAHRWSWEAIAYRDAQDRTTERCVPAGFDAALANIPGGFDNVDAATGRLRAVPRTPCPVRWAVRGLDPQALVDATRTWLDPEASWCLFQTNHATADHARWADARPGPHKVVRARVNVQAAAERRRGGHVFVPAVTAAGDRVTLAAFEPTKSLRAPVGALTPGDRVTVVARTGADTHTWHLEALRMDAPAERCRPGPNPRCACGKATKSRGRDAGFRCPACGARFDATERAQTPLPPPLAAGESVQVPDHVRGHLLPPSSGVGTAHTLDGDLGPHLGPVLAEAPRPAVAPVS